MSWRKMLLATATIIVVAAAFAPTEAAALPPGRVFGWGGAATALDLGLAAVAGYHGTYSGGYGYGGGYTRYGPYGDGCWQHVYAHTFYGPQARRIWACGQSQQR